MSRLAKKPTTILSGVTVSVLNQILSVSGPKGQLTIEMRPIISAEVTAEGVVFTKQEESVFSRALWGTYAAHLRNMMEGVTIGFTKVLEVEGVGYRWALSGSNVEMQLGFSHPVIVAIPEGLTVTTEKNTMTIMGIDKEKVGQFAASIRSLKKPEPYKGKGIRYQGEIIRRKDGKKGA
jgi:large subunit ribosomal protein L6